MKYFIGQIRPQEVKINKIRNQILHFGLMNFYHYKLLGLKYRFLDYSIFDDFFRYFDKIERITFGCWGSSSRGAVALATRRATKFLAPRSAGDTALIFEDIWRHTESIKPFSAEVKSQHLQSPILSRKINPTVKYRYSTEFVFKIFSFKNFLTLYST